MEEQNEYNYRETLEQARSAEVSAEFNEAAMLYKKIIENDPVNQLAYDRLFIMLRKLKDYKQELKYLKAGIKAFEDLGNHGRKKNKKIAELSALLNKSTGLTDKKGKLVYKPEPIAKWEKRKAVVEKRVK